MDSQEDAVVVPLVPLDTEPSTEGMLRMLLDREAVVIRQVAAPATMSSSGMVAQTSGAFAKAVGQATSHLGRNASSAEGLYQVILPSGSVARDLVPAVGGGFRGIVRTAGSTKIAGHARLVPAIAGTGATIAAGPLIATVGLAVAAEMLTQHQINKKLDSIKSAVHSVQQHLDAQDRAVLTTAAQQSRGVASYFLDQASLPAINSASQAFGNLASLANRRIERLDRWVETVEKHNGAERVNAAALMTALVGKRDDQIQQFEREVAQTYEALALRARVIVLEKIAAEFSNPDRSLPHVEEALRAELAQLADRQGQLVGLLDDLSALQLDGSKAPIVVAGRRTIGVRTSFARLARALHAAPEGLPVLTESDRTVLELSPTPQGLAVVAPQSATS